MPRSPYSGPALLGAGFRPFFLAAVLFGLAVVPVWTAVWRGAVDLPGSFPVTDWHIHEMIFGYSAAVIAGFLFTAVPNWTGRMPARGWPLLTLTATWLAGRLAVAGALPLTALGVAFVDCAFLAAVAAVISVEIVAGQNWRNLKVVVPVALLGLANGVFHLEIAFSGGADYGRRLGIALVTFLILLIGGRIIPSFTRNWLAQQGADRFPVPFNRFDKGAAATGALSLAVWVAWPQTASAAILLGIAAGIQCLRLSRWQGLATWRSPLLLMLHVAYLFIPLGLAAMGLAAVGVLSPAAGAHLLGIGAIGGMTAAMMIRATRGHTGRSLVAGKVLSAAFALVAAAALARVMLPPEGIGGLDPVILAALLWTSGFALIAFRISPWLVLPAPERRAPARARP